MEIRAENFGSVVLLFLSGEINANDVELLIADLAEQCATASAIVISLANAKPDTAALTALVRVREQQRWQKPTLTLVSPTIKGLDPDLGKALSQLDNNDGKRVALYQLRRLELTKLKTSLEDIESQISQLVGLPKDTKPEEFEEALQELRRRGRHSQLLASVLSANVETLAKNHQPAPTDEALKKRIKALKAKALAALGD